MAFARRLIKPDPRAPLLEAHGVEVTIGKERILESASLTLERGELLAVVGPNGAGKSTFARAFCGLRRPDGGPDHGRARGGWNLPSGFILRSRSSSGPPPICSQ